MISLKVPKNVYVVKSKQETFGNGKAAFCFYDKNQAENVRKYLSNSPNMFVWINPVNPTKFVLKPNKSLEIYPPRRNDYRIEIMESEKFFNIMLSHNISVRIIDNVSDIDDYSCSLSSFCGIDAKDETDNIKDFEELK